MYSREGRMKPSSDESFWSDRRSSTKFEWLISNSLIQFEIRIKIVWLIDSIVCNSLRQFGCKTSIAWLIDWLSLFLSNSLSQFGIKIRIDWLIGWLILLFVIPWDNLDVKQILLDWLIDWLIQFGSKIRIVWLIGWLIDWLIQFGSKKRIDWLIDWLVYLFVFPWANGRELCTLRQTHLHKQTFNLSDPGNCFVIC